MGKNSQYWKRDLFDHCHLLGSGTNGKEQDGRERFSNALLQALDKKESYSWMQNPGHKNDSTPLARS